MSININWSKERVHKFLEDNTATFQLDKKIISKIKEQEIDGEAFSLLVNDDLKNLGIKRVKVIDNILSCAEKDILKTKDNVTEDKVYSQVYKDDVDNIWNSLDERLKELKLGEKVKFIKYLIMRDPPPDIEQQEQFIQYMKKVLNADDDSESIDEIKDNIDDLFRIKIGEDLLKGKKDEIFKLKIIIELLKKKKSGKVKPEEIKDEIKLEIKNEAENDEEAAPSNEENIDNNNYEIYPLIESFKYRTSQSEFIYGLLKPKEGFKSICNYFEINYEDDCNKIDYDKACKIKLTSFMLWGSKEGLNKFWKDNKIQKAIDYYKEEKKEGIYLCVERNQQIAYLIIWPGEDKYKYSNLYEPNNKLLLTLIRYGFSLSQNSILSLADEEIIKFEKNKYEIFKKEEENKVHKSQTYENNSHQEKKIFRLSAERLLKEKINDTIETKIENKPIIKSKIRQNYILLYLADKASRSKTSYSKKFNEFINLTSKYHLYFDDNFNCLPEMLYILLSKKEDPLYIQGLNDIVSMKINKLFKLIDYYLIYEENLKEFFVCQFCKDKDNYQPNKIYYTHKDKDLIFFHKNCYLKQNHKNASEFNFKTIIEGKIIENKKLNIYNENKKEILDLNLDDKLINTPLSGDNFPHIFKQFFTNCESKFKKNSNDSNNKKNKGILSSVSSMVSTIISPFQNYFSATPTYNNIDGKIIKGELEKLIESILENPNIKNKIIMDELQNYKNLPDKEKKNSILPLWKVDIIEKINAYYINNSTKIKKWIVLKSIEGDVINYDEYEIKNDNYSLSLFEISQIENTEELSIMLKYSNLNDSCDKISEICDYYYQKSKKDLIIYKNLEKNKYQMPFRNQILNDCELYDYDNMSDTLILFKKEKIKNGYIKKLGLYLSNNPLRSLDTQFLGDNQNYVLKKIILIPCYEKYAKQSALFFIENNKEIIINVLNVIEQSVDSKILELSKEFNEFKNLEEFQFIIYDFLLILKYNNKIKKWDGKIYSLNLEDNSLFNKITEIIIDDNKQSLFSFFENTNKKNIYYH